MARVYNMRRPHPGDAQLVDRTTPFGNPFKFLAGPEDEDFKRAASLGTYRVWVMQPEQASLRQLMRECLKNQDLVCWCAPKPCHADIILAIANTDNDEEVVLDGPT
jgi:hypothetical protein